MTTRQAELIRTSVYVAVIVVYLAALAYVAVPGVKARLERGRAWARWYHYRAWFSMLPPWLQEGLTVRGRAPA